MLMKPKARLKAGDTVDLAFRFADGTVITAKAVVKKGAPGFEGMQMQEHHRMN